MRLAVFDIDGTLTQTTAVDGRCFNQAVREVFSFEKTTTDWTSYTEITDEGIAREIHLKHFGSEATAERIDALKNRFLQLLEEEALSNPLAFQETPGASTFLTALKNQGWCIALATGAWKRSAELKLQRAGLHLGLPLATSDDSSSRVKIVAKAIERAKRLYAVSSFEKIVSLGDGAWDVRVAKEMKLPFVGVGKGDQEQRLKEEGARHVLADFLEMERAMAALTEARLPGH